MTRREFNLCGLLSPNSKPGLTLRKTSGRPRLEGVSQNTWAVLPQMAKTTKNKAWWRKSLRTKVTRALNVTCTLDVCWRGHLWTLNKVWNGVNNDTRTGAGSNHVEWHYGKFKLSEKHGQTLCTIFATFSTFICKDNRECSCMSHTQSSRAPLEIQGPQGSYTFKSMQSTKFKFPLQHLLP